MKQWYCGLYISINIEIQSPCYVHWLGSKAVKYAVQKYNKKIKNNVIIKKSIKCNNKYVKIIL